MLTLQILQVSAVYLTLVQQNNSTTQNSLSINIYYFGKVFTF